jgi:hypothetical protein
MPDVGNPCAETILRRDAADGDVDGLSCEQLLPAIDEPFEVVTTVL